MYWPYIVWALPRSRTAWMQTWLGGPQVCGHDSAIGTKSPQEFFDKIWHGLAGTVETGNPTVSKLASVAMPGVRQLIVKRKLSEVIDSVRKITSNFNLNMLEIENELTKREQALLTLESEGIPAINYSDLNNPECCAWVFEYLTQSSFDFNWWQVASSKDIQINTDESISRQIKETSKFIVYENKLFQQLKNPGGNKFLRLGKEPWSSFWHDAQVIAENSYMETDPDLPFNLDNKFFIETEAAGKLLVCSARINGAIVGWITWTLGTSALSANVPLATQGSFWVSSTAYGIAKKLIDWSIWALNKLGYFYLNWHFNFAGRGNKIPNYLLRLGAKPQKILLGHDTKVKIPKEPSHG